MQMIYEQYRLFEIRCFFKKNANAKKQNRNNTKLIDFKKRVKNFEIFEIV